MMASCVCVHRARVWGGASFGAEDDGNGAGVLLCRSIGAMGRVAAAVDESCMAGLLCFRCPVGVQGDDGSVGASEIQHPQHP